MLTKWDARNQVLKELLERLRSDPANLEIADRYWNALEGSKSGSGVMVAYREAALKSVEGVVALARAQRELFLASGELPRRADLDEQLLRALWDSLLDLPKSEQTTVRWVLESLR